MRTFHGIFEHLLESHVILVVLEDRHPRVGTVQNVVNESTSGCSVRSSRAQSPAKPAISVKKRFLTPFKRPRTREGKQHPDRDAQFQYINKNVRRFQRRGLAVISVDAKKREIIGEFANRGREWQPKRNPEKVRTHNFADKHLGVAIPYGVYDQTQNNGWVSIGIDHNTADFASATIREWWYRMGAVTYPSAAELLMTADSGGSNGIHCRLWKKTLQDLANELNLKLTVCHFPPGTSKWNNIEHRMFCHITENWRGRPLISRAVIVNLIGNTTTDAGLTINADVDTNRYPKGVKVSDEEMAAIKKSISFTETGITRLRQIVNSK